MKKVILNKMQWDKNLFALVDDEYFENVDKYPWNVHKGKSGILYAISHPHINRVIYMHRLIMDAKEGQIIDHINRNGLDNRKENLRFCDYSLNAMNSKSPSDNTSGVKGVYWNKQRNKWQAQIVVNGKCIPLGRFNNLEDGRKSRLEAERKYFPNL